MLPNLAIMGTTWGMLIDKARMARYANGIPTGLAFEEEVERDLCKSYPQECLGGDPNTQPSRSLTLADVLHGTQVMVAHKLAGSALVEKEVAYSRASICASNNCGQNVEFKKRCGSCTDVEKLVKSIVGNAPTPYDSRLNSCAVCACSLKAAVWVPGDIQAIGITDAQRTQFKAIAETMKADGHTPCWKAAL